MDIKSILKAQTQHKVGISVDQDSDSGTTAMSSNFLNKTIHSVGHDLRSPIFVIRSYAGLIQKISDNNRMNKMSGMIHEATLKMEKQINGLVELIDLYTLPVPEPECISDTELLEQLKFELSNFNIHETKNIKVDFSAVSNLHFPKKYLMLLLVQLVDNAFRHNAEQANLEVELFAKKEADGITIIVSDNGKGMDLTHSVEEVISPFYTHTDDESCIGLGLAKVSAIAQVSGCTYQLESKPEKGTVFQFKIPENF